MSFFTRRADPAVDGLRAMTPPPVPVDNQPLISCCRHLALLPRHQLAADHGLAAVGQEFDRVMADPALATAIIGNDRPWPVIAPHLLDLLLATAGRALPTDPSLTGLIADTVLRARRGSRAAWRLRALAHEQWGDLNSAITAHEEYLARTEHDKLGVGALVTTLRGLRDSRVALASALIDAHDDEIDLPMPGAADLHDLLSRPVRQEDLEPVLEEFLSDLTRLPVSGLTGMRDVLQAVVQCLRTSRPAPPPLPAATVRSVAVLRLGDLRGRLAGRSICLVADTGRLASAGDGSRLGARIDGYDLVARVASGPLDPERTGSRTDLMVVRHDQGTGWDQPADLRLVLAEDPDDWVRAVRRNLVPGAQRGLFDKSLRRPAAVGDEPGPLRPTSAFQLLLLLDHLDVNPAIDLIGFGNADPFTDLEQEWLRPRVRGTGDNRVSLR